MKSLRRRSLRPRQVELFQGRRPRPGPAGHCLYVSRRRRPEQRTVQGLGPSRLDGEPSRGVSCHLPPGNGPSGRHRPADSALGIDSVRGCCGPAATSSPASNRLRRAPACQPHAPRAPMGTTLARSNRPRRRLGGSDGLLRVRQSLALLSDGPDVWGREADGGLERLQAVGRNLGVARLIVSTEDGNAPLDVWCGPVSSRAMRPVPTGARPGAGSHRIYCRSGILALPLRGPQVVFGVLTLIATQRAPRLVGGADPGRPRARAAARRRARPLRGTPAGAGELRLQPRRARLRVR